MGGKDVRKMKEWRGGSPKFVSQRKKRMGKREKVCGWWGEKKNTWEQKRFREETQVHLWNAYCDREKKMSGTHENVK